jgi:ERF superfamily
VTTTIEHSDDLAELAAAIIEVQAAMPKIPKTSDNPFFKSKYADLADVKTLADPIITKHGLAVTQWPSNNDKGDTLVTMLLHRSGQFIKSEMQLHLTKSDAQGQGSALTYARRYAYMASLGLVADVDDDGNRSSQPQSNRSEAKPKPQAKARAAKNADPKTGEVLHNLQPKMLEEIKGADRPRFLEHLGSKYEFKITAVPDSKREEVEKVIGEWSAGRPFSDDPGVKAEA